MTTLNPVAATGARGFLNKLKFVFLLLKRQPRTPVSNTATGIEKGAGKVNKDMRGETEIHVKRYLKKEQQIAFFIIGWCDQISVSHTATDMA
ncbi:MAG: hypothetical protein IIB64_08290 [Proteobacteria bacterium]|nr:hypothetical protein [Pseudomonadota bacterium]